jgi:hypothetical protein
MRVLRAEIIMEPLRNSYKTIALPDSISLYYSDRMNRFVLAIQDRITLATEVANLSIDNIFQEDTRYSIEVTDFIDNKLTEESDDTPALLLTITPSKLNRTFDRLILGSQLHADNKLKLKIYYMNYE